MIVWNQIPYNYRLLNSPDKTQIWHDKKIPEIKRKSSHNTHTKQEYIHNITNVVPFQHDIHLILQAHKPNSTRFLHENIYKILIAQIPMSKHMQNSTKT